MRARLAGLLGVAIIAASCGSPNATPPASSTLTATPSAIPSPSVTPGTSAAPTAAVTPTPTPSPAPTAAGRWEATGSMALARAIPRAVLLGNGKVLVVGNDEDSASCVRSDSAQSETWDPGSGTWSAGPSLNAPRADFAAVPVGGGGALVTGGVTAGAAASVAGAGDHQSYSSTYIYDPRSEPAAWSRTGLLGWARTLPTAVALLDERVLVAGGYYLSGGAASSGPTSLVELAAYGGSRSEPTPAGPPSWDVAPPTMAPTYATAELYDPATGSWSATGPLHYARVGAPAVTLVDGRALVVGSVRSWAGWNYTQPKLDGRAYETAEIYDPRTGRFSLTGDLPAVDWSPLAKWGPYPVNSDGVTSPGALVALSAGGALLVGQVTTWSILALDMSGSTVRTLRLDPATGRWTVIDQSVTASVSVDGTTSAEVILGGHSRDGSLAVRLRDGRVLVAGGGDPRLDTPPTNAADLYDPVANTWLALPPMPEPRAGGAAVLLVDGSVLVVGGQGGTPTCEQSGTCQCGAGATGTSSAVRFVPGT